MEAGWRHRTGPSTLPTYRLSRGAHLGRCAGGGSRSRATGRRAAQLAATPGLRAHRTGLPSGSPRDAPSHQPPSGTPTPAGQGSAPCRRPSVLEPLSSGGEGLQQVSHLRPRADTGGGGHRAASPVGAGPSEGTASCRAAAGPGRSPSPPVLKPTKMPRFSSGAWKTFCLGTLSPHPGGTRRGLLPGREPAEKWPDPFKVVPSSWAGGFVSSPWDPAILH